MTLWGINRWLRFTGFRLVIEQWDGRGKKPPDQRLWIRWWGSPREETPPERRHPRSLLYHHELIRVLGQAPSGQWLPSRPITWTLADRIRGAWHVLLGRAAPVRWI